MTLAQARFGYSTLCSATGHGEANFIQCRLEENSGKVMKGTKMKAMKVDSVGSSLTAEKDPKEEAIWMCQQLSDGKLNPESLKRGYVLLRNAANKWVNLPQIQKLVKDLKQPTENWYHLMFAHVCGFMIDNLIAVCSMLEEDWVYKILFSDEKDKHFFSCGVEHGHFIRAGADQFLEFSRAYKVSDFEAAIKCESSHMKLLENLLVKFVHLREEVELPRLGLTFRAPDERTSKSAAERPRGVPALRCDQYGGLKVLGERSVHNQKSLQRLIKPFPRFVLLEDEVGDLFLLASLAERPRRSTQGLEWIRGDSSWLSKLRLEQRHQLYRIFVNEILVAPNVLAELHLMLLRVAQGMFGDACSSVAACTASTLPQPPEESLLWEEMTSMLQGDTSMGATVLRLKLILQLHRQGQGVPDGWNPEADFLAWANYGFDAPEGRLLTLEEDAALLDLLGGSSEEAHWQLRTRSAVHRQLLQVSAARGHVTQGEADGTAGRGGVVVRAVLDGRMGIHFPYLLWVGYGWIEYAAEAASGPAAREGSGAARTLRARPTRAGRGTAGASALTAGPKGCARCGGTALLRTR
ncbi:Hypothetical protein (Fragment) [Durusdinium trenchii]|uniref:Uncharacterized protein n=1 Tax=Durusdinium trenchii TaxID=1381693 RepID=A0ABP0HNV4_9DINO